VVLDTKRFAHRVIDDAKWAAHLLIGNPRAIAHELRKVVE